MKETSLLVPDNLSSTCSLSAVLSREMSLARLPLSSTNVASDFMESLVPTGARSLTVPSKQSGLPNVKYETFVLTLPPKTFKSWSQSPSHGVLSYVSSKCLGNSLSVSYASSLPSSVAKGTGTGQAKDVTTFAVASADQFMIPNDLYYMIYNDGPQPVLLSCHSLYMEDGEQYLLMETSPPSPDPSRLPPSAPLTKETSLLVPSSSSSTGSLSAVLSREMSLTRHPFSPTTVQKDYMESFVPTGARSLTVPSKQSGLPNVKYETFVLTLPPKTFKSWSQFPSRGVLSYVSVECSRNSLSVSYASSLPSSTGQAKDVTTFAVAIADQFMIPNDLYHMIYNDGPQPALLSCHSVYMEDDVE